MLEAENIRFELKKNKVQKKLDRKSAVKQLPVDFASKIFNEPKKSDNQVKGYIGEVRKTIEQADIIFQV